MLISHQLRYFAPKKGSKLRGMKNCEIIDGFYNREKNGSSIFFQTLSLATHLIPDTWSAEIRIIYNPWNFSALGRQKEACLYVLG